MPPIVKPQDHKRKISKKQDVDKYMPTAWGSGAGVPEDLTVPSGQVCLVQRPGVQRLIEAGVLRDVDTLTSIVAEEHVRRVNGDTEINARSLSRDVESIANVLHVVDRVICHVVVRPEIHMTLNDMTGRQDDLVYADMIDIEDKMFIFNFAVGGTRDVEQFRAGSLQSLGSMDDVKDVEDNTK